MSETFIRRVRAALDFYEAVRTAAKKLSDSAEEVVARRADIAAMAPNDARKIRLKTAEAEADRLVDAYAKPLDAAEIFMFNEIEIALAEAKGEEPQLWPTGDDA